MAGAAIHPLAVTAGVLTAFLARDAIPQGWTQTTGPWAIVGLGLLASGSSSFWNSVLGYLDKLKNAA